MTAEVPRRERQRPEVKKERDHLSDVMKALDESTITAITDKNGTIIYANRKFEEISKYPVLELLGKNHRILKSGFHPPEFFDKMWDTISSGRVWRGTVKNHAKDGSIYWVNTVITPFLDDDGIPEQYMAIRMDVTKEKALEEDLHKALQKVEETQKEKEEFVAMVTHDLKGHLAPIKGNVSLLKMKDMGELSKEQLECVNEIDANATKQLTMIESLISAQKIGLDSMKYDITELSTKDVIQDVLKTWDSIMKEKKINFHGTLDDIKFKGDKRRVGEVFSNLIQNSHDFVSNNGEISIGCADREDHVEFFVKDNGKGIPKDKQEGLFEKYKQVVSDQKRKYGGTGLGLSICLALVTGMNGKIWFESEEGKGATFFFTIPKAD